MPDKKIEVSVEKPKPVFKYWESFPHECINCHSRMITNGGPRHNASHHCSSCNIYWVWDAKLEERIFNIETFINSIRSAFNDDGTLKEKP